MTCWIGSRVTSESPSSTRCCLPRGISRCICGENISIGCSCRETESCECTSSGYIELVSRIIVSDTDIGTISSKDDSSTLDRLSTTTDDHTILYSIIEYSSIRSDSNIVASYHTRTSILSSDCGIIYTRHRVTNNLSSECGVQSTFHSGTGISSSDCSVLAT